PTLALDEAARRQFVLAHAVAVPLLAAGSDRLLLFRREPKELHAVRLDFPRAGAKVATGPPDLDAGLEPVKIRWQRELQAASAANLGLQGVLGHEQGAQVRHISDDSLVGAQAAEVQLGLHVHDGTWSSALLLTVA